jgi:hypothetical protein
VSEQVVLVAFQVEAESMAEAQQELASDIVLLPGDRDSSVVAWWFAEDERYDGSDYESAVFIPEGSGISQRNARILMEIFAAIKKDA